MRKFAGLLLALALTSCGLLRFDVGQDISEQRVPGSPIPGSGIIPTFLEIPFTIDLQMETAARNTGPATSAALKSLTLSATPRNQPSGNFDFLDEVHIFVSSPNNSSLPRLEIATLNPVPRGQTTVSFTITPNVDLLPYINAGAQITSTATGRQPANDFTFDGRVVVTIRV